MKKQLRPILVGTLFLFFCTGTALAGTAAMDQLKQTVDGVLNVLRDKSTPLEERKQKIAQLVADRFDYKIMAQSAMGKHWRKFSPQQKEEFTEKFSHLLKSSYLDRIDAYTDESVDYVKERKKRGKVLIETDIVTANKRIPIHYKMREKNGVWLVYDVVIEGVSLIRNYRSSYGDIYSRDGYEGLIQKMDQKKITS